MVSSTSGSPPSTVSGASAEICGPRAASRSESRRRFDRPPRPSSSPCCRLSRCHSFSACWATARTFTGRRFAKILSRTELGRKLCLSSHETSNRIRVASRSGWAANWCGSSTHRPAYSLKSPSIWRKATSPSPVASSRSLRTSSTASPWSRHSSVPAPATCSTRIPPFGPAPGSRALYTMLGR